MTKKAVSILLVIALSLCFFGCTPHEEPTQPQLDMPTNLTITDVSDTAVLRWDAVIGATEYIVTDNGDEHKSIDPYYTFDTVTIDHELTVVARGVGYLDSEPAAAAYTSRTVTLGITGGSEVKSGKTLQLSATVKGIESNAVTWEIASGGQYVSIDDKGLVTAKTVDGDKIFTVRATSLVDPTASVTKAFTVASKPELTQDMLNALNDDYVAFVGYMNIDLYTFGLTTELRESASYDIKTAMDGERWYASYTMTGGLNSGMYVKKIAGDGGDMQNAKAGQVTVSFTNEEKVEPMVDDNDVEISWEEAGLYNSLKSLNVNDFKFNEKNWRYEYNGADKNTLLPLVISSANPYDFTPVDLSLIIDNGEVAGIRSTAAPDYAQYQGYRADKELIVAVNIGEDNVTVPIITKYEYDEVRHKSLNDAIANMKKLKCYTTEVLNVSMSYLTSRYTYEGYIETIAPDVCHFKPYTLVTSNIDEVAIGKGFKVWDNEVYGYVNRSVADDPDHEEFYNAYFATKVESEDTTTYEYETSRAYKQSFANAAPSFDFSAAIFTKYYKDEETGEETYYVDNPMSAVATTFYHGVGTDIQLFGMYATEGRTNTTELFTPYVTVKDGYITEAGFYYYLGYLVGIMQIEYRDFNDTAACDAALAATNVRTDLANLAVREIPSRWSDLVITDTLLSDVDTEYQAEEYLKILLKYDDVDTLVPFFSEPLGDTFGFGLATLRSVGQAYQTLSLYYDLPLDIDYSLNSSLRAVKTYLGEKCGFTKGANNVFYKEYSGTDGKRYRLNIQPSDANLDFFIHIWRAAA